MRIVPSPPPMIKSVDVARGGACDCRFDALGGDAFDGDVVAARDECRLDDVAHGIGLQPEGRSRAQVDDGMDLEPAAIRRAVFERSSGTVAVADKLGSPNSIASPA